MCDRNVKSENILIKLCALVSEYVCERTKKFHEKILFDSGVINLIYDKISRLPIQRKQLAKTINMVFSAEFPSKPDLGEAAGPCVSQPDS